MRRVLLSFNLFLELPENADIIEFEEADGYVTQHVIVGQHKMRPVIDWAAYPPEEAGDHGLAVDTWERVEDEIANELIEFTIQEDWRFMEIGPWLDDEEEFI